MGRVKGAHHPGAVRDRTQLREGWGLVALEGRVEEQERGLQRVTAPREVTPGGAEGPCGCRGPWTVGGIPEEEPPLVLRGVALCLAQVGDRQGRVLRPREWQQRWALLGHQGRELCVHLLENLLACAWKVRGSVVPFRVGRGSLHGVPGPARAPESRSRPGPRRGPDCQAQVWAAARPGMEDRSAGAASRGEPWEGPVRWVDVSLSPAAGPR